MRTITETTTVYTFAELSTDAQEKAVQEIQNLLAGPWWDENDNEQIGEVILYTLAERLKAPGWDTYGPGDFPGIDGLTIQAWAMDRGQTLAVSGTLYRDNAPGLPWVDGIDNVNLTAHRDSTEITVHDVEPECTCSPDHYLQPHDEGCPSLQPPVIDEAARDALEQAVRDALSDAWQAGETEMDHKTSEEYAKERAEDYEFTEDGTFYG